MRITGWPDSIDYTKNVQGIGGVGVGDSYIYEVFQFDVIFNRQSSVVRFDNCNIQQSINSFPINNLPKSLTNSFGLQRAPFALQFCRGGLRVHQNIANAVQGA